MARSFRGANAASGLEMRGLDDVMKTLGRMNERQARAVLRGAPNAAAALARKEARQNAPRNNGVLRRAIKNAPQNSRTKGPGAAVFVEHGAGAKADGFYWRFIEYGTVKMAARPFMRPTIDRLAGSGALAKEMGDYIRARWAKYVKAARR